MARNIAITAATPKSAASARTRATSGQCGSNPARSTAFDNTVKRRRMQILTRGS
jgi:hypothetical protein